MDFHFRDFPQVLWKSEVNVQFSKDDNEPGESCRRCFLGSLSSLRFSGSCWISIPSAAFGQALWSNQAHPQTQLHCLGSVQCGRDAVGSQQFISVLRSSVEVKGLKSLDTPQEGCAGSQYFTSRRNTNFSLGEWHEQLSRPQKDFLEQGRWTPVWTERLIHNRGPVAEQQMPWILAGSDPGTPSSFLSKGGYVSPRV